MTTTPAKRIDRPMTHGMTNRERALCPRHEEQEKSKLESSQHPLRPAGQRVLIDEELDDGGRKDGIAEVAQMGQLAFHRGKAGVDGRETLL